MKMLNLFMHFSDVTLVSNNFFQINAHKIIQTSSMFNLDVAVASFWQLARHWKQGDKAKLPSCAARSGVNRRLGLKLMKLIQRHKIMTELKRISMTVSLMIN